MFQAHRLFTRLVSLTFGGLLLCASDIAVYAESAAAGGLAGRSWDIGSEVKCVTIFAKEFCDLYIEFKGEIVTRSVEKIQSILDAEKLYVGRLGAHSEHKHLVIDSPGGSVEASMAIGRLLRENRISIVVAKGGRCVSACVLVFAGAVQRSAFGKIGIHRPYLNENANSQPITAEKIKSSYGEMLDRMRAYLRAMNVSEGLADDMIKVAPAEIRYLGQDDLNNYGLSFHDPVEQETLDLEDARSLGLDRSEHIRRQAIKRKECGEGPRLGTVQSFTEWFDCGERVMKFGK